MDTQESAGKLGFGIDIGGSGIKGALVDLKTGEFVGERIRIKTPEPSTPEAVVDTIGEIIKKLDVPKDVPIGVAFPGPIQKNIITYIANLDKSWLNVNLRNLVRDRLGFECSVANDADAAGYGECHFGAGRNEDGLIFATTLGTGIGTAFIYQGVLIPNCELGHIVINGYDAETRAAASARDREQLGWEEYAERLQLYYSTVEHLFSPDVIIIGGGVSEKYDKFIPLLNLKAKVVPATLRNRAGIVGAAYFASSEQKRNSKLSTKLKNALESRSENAV